MQIPLPSVQPHRDALHFVVVGGSIAGLASACALSAAGHHVTVLEQDHVHLLSKCREAIRSTPTMTQIFHDWGIGDRFTQMSTPLDQTTILDGQSGNELGLIVINGRISDTLPADFVACKFGDLFNMLYEIAHDLDVQLYYGYRVTSVDPWRAIVTCEDGQQFAADVIIGADGYHSIVRPVVLGPSAPLPEYDNIVTLSYVVPADIARKDEDLAALLDMKSWTGWLADDCSVHGVLSGPGPGRDYALVMNINTRNRKLHEIFPPSLDWLGMDTLEPRIQKLLKLARPLRKYSFAHYPPFDNWVHESGKVVLIGQAAHPSIPFGSHTNGMCIEDAMTLSALFSVPATKAHTPMLLSVYEELRQPRCATVQRYMRRKREFVTVPYRVGQRTRDALVRDQRSFVKNNVLDGEFLYYATYSGFVKVYGYNAREVVLDWWVKIGRGLFLHSSESENEEENEEDGEDDDDDPELVPLVDAEIERLGQTHPNIPDPLLGDLDDIVREVKVHRRSLQ